VIAAAQHAARQRQGTIYNVKTIENIVKILPSSDDPSPRFLLPKLVDFVAGVTNKKKQKTHTVNDKSPHYMRRQKKPKPCA